jgi:hypothetical protein
MNTKLEYFGYIELVDINPTTMPTHSNGREHQPRVNEI